MTAAAADPSPVAIGRRRRWLLFWGVVALLALYQWALPRWRSYLETLAPWEVAVGPFVATTAAGELLVVTVVRQERVDWERPTLHGHADDQVVALQLNRPDASDAGRILVVRSEKNVRPDVRVLGTTPDRVWLFAEGLRAVSLSRRTLDVDPSVIEARLPALRGLLSDDGRHYALNANGGITLTARDGRRWDLDAAVARLTPAPAETPPPRAQNMEEWNQQMRAYDRAVAEATGPRSASAPGEFGLDAWRSGLHWFGILSDTARAELGTRWERPRRAAFGRPERRQLWLADATAPPGTDPDGTVTLGNVRGAPNGREYLRGGILRDGARLRAVVIPDSPDVVLEHYTAIDASAELRLTRVTPAGDERWTAAVPLRFPSDVAAAGDYVVVTGLPPGVDDERRMQLVSVRLSDGRIGIYSYEQQ